MPRLDTGRPPATMLDDFKQSLWSILGSERLVNLSSALDAWRPATDIRENADRYLLEIELPGIEREQIEITLTNNELSIRCQREDQPSADWVIRRERHLGQFVRHFLLPQDAVADQISDRMQNGVLLIYVPRAAALTSPGADAETQTQ